MFLSPVSSHWFPVNGTPTTAGSVPYTGTQFSLGGLGHVHKVIYLMAQYTTSINHSWALTA